MNAQAEILMLRCMLAGAEDRASVATRLAEMEKRRADEAEANLAWASDRLDRIERRSRALVA